MLKIMQRDLEGAVPGRTPHSPILSSSVFRNDLSELPTMCRIASFQYNQQRRGSSSPTSGPEELDYLSTLHQNDANLILGGGQPKRKIRRLMRKDLSNENEKSPVSGLCDRFLFAYNYHHFYLIAFDFVANLPFCLLHAVKEITSAEYASFFCFIVDQL